MEHDKIFSNLDLSRKACSHYLCPFFSLMTVDVSKMRRFAKVCEGACRECNHFTKFPGVKSSQARAHDTNTMEQTRVLKVESWFDVESRAGISGYADLSQATTTARSYSS
jgi:hypothetical protein